MADYFIGVTSIPTFGTCNRAWFWRHVDRLILRDFQKSRELGTLIHAFLAGYYQSLKEGDNYTDAYERGFLKLDESYYGMQQEWGEINSAGLAEILDIAIGVTRNYVDPFSEYEIVAVEHPIGHTILGTSPSIAIRGIIDLILRDKEGGLHLVDHKTKARFDSYSGLLRIDTQLLTYAFLWYVSTGTSVIDVTHNEILRKYPQSPPVLKSGKLSTSAQTLANTTKEVYYDAIIDNELDPEEYQDALDYLEKFPGEWTRQITVPIANSLNYFSENMAKSLTMIARALSDRDSFDYASPSLYHCRTCPYQEVCITQFMGGDYKTILTGLFMEETLTGDDEIES